MKDREIEPFEAELRSLKPARPPEELIARLAEARPALPTPIQADHRPWPWWRIASWIAPATAGVALVAALLIGRLNPADNAVKTQPGATPTPPVFQADNVEIDQQLVASFDAVAEMPDGAPVRFRCREWTDQVVLRDSAQGVVIERRVPRLEIEPVRFEVF